VRGGANLLDVNMDADLLESEAAMVRSSTSSPQSLRSPASGDGRQLQGDRPRSRLKCLQGKGVANSISLKGGEESFLEQARLCASTGRPRL